MTKEVQILGGKSDSQNYYDVWIKILLYCEIIKKYSIL